MSDQPLDDSKLSRICRDSNTKKLIENFLGIIRGILADGEISHKEIEFVHNWISSNPILQREWPTSDIYTLTSDFIAIKTDKLYNSIKIKFNELNGFSFGEASTMPLDSDVKIVFTAKKFCFTGKFDFGSRTKCEKVVKDLGATVAAKGVTKNLDYLVIGHYTNPDWKHTNYGTKIETAMRYKKQGSEIYIVSEADWRWAIDKTLKSDKVA